MQPKPPRAVAGTRRNVTNKHVERSPGGVAPVLSPDQKAGGSEAAVYALVVGVGGVVSCAGRDRDVRLLDARDGRCTARMEGHTDRVWALAGAGDDTLASASADKTVRLWRPAERACVRALRGHRGAVQALAVHRGLLLSGSADQSVRLWDLHDGACVGSLLESTAGRNNGDRDAVHSLCPLPGDALASGCWGGAVRIWDLHRCKATKTLTAHTGAVWALAHADGRLCTAGSDGLLKLWDVRQGACTGALGSATSGALYALAERDGLLVTGGYDQLVKVWDARMGRCLNELAGHSGSVRCLAFHGTQLLSGSTDGTVRLWDFDSLLAVDPGAPLPSVVEDTDGLAAAGLVGAEELGV